MFTCFYIEKVHSEIADSIIRLHIIANSDSVEDQQQKLAVRDFVLERYGKTLKAETRDQALEKIYGCLPQILKDVQDLTDQQVQISISESNFPTKIYKDLQLPAGNYLALKIVLGSGKGKNWWCVMYPPLCFQDASSVTDKEKLKQVLSEDEYELITSQEGTVLYKFKIVELWNKLKAL